MAENESEKKLEFHFVQLVMMFQAAAMQQMGKVQNPITKKVERNLDQARFSIDMLEIIQNKTRNNLSENQSTFLEHTLYGLRMNYLDEVKRGKPEEEKEDSTQKEQQKKPSSSGESKGREEKQPENDKQPDQKEQGRNQPASSDSNEKKD
jgi:hypothetical protein